MTEEEARDWVRDHFGPERYAIVAAIGERVRQESERQNLIAPSTLETMWSRHLTDSAQLLRLAPADARRWIDVGTGAGFPGVVVAALFDGEVALVEPRGKRATFLKELVAAFSLTATVHQARAEAVALAPADVISARAVATTDALLRMTTHLRHAATMMILPRGQGGEREIEPLQRDWRGVFHVKHSLTDQRSIILTATGVAARCSVSP